MSSVCCLTSLQRELIRILINPPNALDKARQSSFCSSEAFKLSLQVRLTFWPPFLSTWAHTGISWGCNGYYCLRCKIIIAFIYTLSYGLNFHQLLSCITYQIVSSCLINSFNSSQSDRYPTSIDKTLPSSLWWTKLFILSRHHWKYLDQNVFIFKNL